MKEIRDEFTQLFQEMAVSSEAIKRIAEGILATYRNYTLATNTPDTSRSHSLESSMWLDVSEAAARARVGNKLIYREVKAGRLKAARVGGRRQLRFRAQWIDAWLDSTSQPVE